MGRNALSRTAVTRASYKSLNNAADAKTRHDSKKVGSPNKNHMRRVQTQAGRQHADDEVATFTSDPPNAISRRRRTRQQHGTHSFAVHKNEPV